MLTHAFFLTHAHPGSPWGGISLEGHPDLHIIAKQYPDCFEVPGWNPQRRCHTSHWCSGTTGVPTGAGQRPASCDQSVQTVPGWQRHRCHWQALTFLQPKSSWAPMAHYVLVHSVPPSTTTDCAGFHWGPDPSLGGDPPGHHPLTHKSMPRCYWVCIQSWRGHTHFRVKLWIVH